MNKNIWLCFIVAFYVTSAAEVLAQTVWLDELNLSTMDIGWGTPQAKKSVDGNPLSIAGQKFERGVGTHAISRMLLNANGKGERFTAFVGVDDEANTRASVEFFLVGDKKILWRSGVMKKGNAAKQVDLDIRGMKLLGLLVTDAGDGISYDHADWCEARITFNTSYSLSTLTEAISPSALTSYILTPKASEKPRINGAKVFGVRPGHPFLYTIAATGQRPMIFATKDLPKGLALDESTGRINGSLDKEGEYYVVLGASNAFGKAERTLRIVVGENICLTPPLGWNSWNCWAEAIDDAKVRAAAKAFVEAGLVNHGWTYINIDDTWQGARGGAFNAILSNEKFPDMKALSDYVHSLGLKIGIYSTPWVTSYAKFCGGSSDSANGGWTKEMASNKFWRHGKYSFEQNDAEQWAQWGIDYLKYDWNPNNVEAVQKMKDALRSSGRDIVYSLSNSAPFEYAAEWARLANCWRTTGDIIDTWASMSAIGFSQDRWRPFGGPGHWNDPDMLVVGLVGWGPQLHPTKLTPDEQYTHISLWCLHSAPLLLGCDLARLDDFTLSLLTNDEVLEVNQDPLGKQARLVSRNDGKDVWVKDLEDGSKAVGLFFGAEDANNPVSNFRWGGETKAKISFQAAELGLHGKFIVRDLWRQQDLGHYESQFESEVPYHGVVLLKVTPLK